VHVYSRCLFGLLISIFIWFERRIFGRLNAIIPASKTIKARASSYLISYMEQQTLSVHGHRLAYQQAGYLGMEGLFWFDWVYRLDMGHG
jgi:hypothetical protein